jgi:hypothetical protein
MGLSLRPRTNSKSLYSVLLPETKQCVTFNPFRLRTNYIYIKDEEEDRMRKLEERRKITMEKERRYK